MGFKEFVVKYWPLHVLFLIFVISCVLCWVAENKEPKGNWMKGYKWTATASVIGMYVYTIYKLPPASV